ncbi:Trehalose import ATP-binding protein SugC [Candidatus Izimaplasma bacterium HR1]|jgi:multiple sugar transport system ATP-binding protein|uniref:ABC transporter ATP-binding protein n=1 Tax=Candidatus Izimoplasma sp. HR1 TaxID=1541959 RepID=UPI0004F7760C|nr:Trehalose import ATP-binding protein SugC [Candidatus Izimaplasma bacterium HR1]
MEIKLQNVTKIFQAKDKTETVAVNGLDIVIPSGKLIGLLGPSGCGKSTTLYMIAGLLDPNEGRIFFGDEDVTDMPPEERGIGLVFQNYALYPHMTVRQNIMFPLENIKVPKQEAVERAQEMADLVGIGELMDRKPKQLSGGQQQRVAIARALVKKPRVLLLDEPLSNLDARLRLQTREEIKRIQRETGITTIFVTHDQEEAMSISDEIVLMELGVKQQVGEPQNVYDKPDNLFVAKFLGTPPINIFDGEIKGGKVLINNIEIGKVKSDDQEVVVGIRPEGFDVVKTGTLKLEVFQVETIGRDTTLIIKDPTDDNKTFRSIVDAQYRVKPGDIVDFEVKDHKLYVFDKDTGVVL